MVRVSHSNLSPRSGWRCSRGKGKTVFYMVVGRHYADALSKISKTYTQLLARYTQ